MWFSKKSTDWQKLKLEQLVDALETMKDRGAIKLDLSQAAYLIAAAAAAIYGFARVELYMQANTNRLAQIEETRFNDRDWIAARAILNAEIRSLDAGLQRLCQELVSVAHKHGESPSLECPITIRGERSLPGTDG